MRQGEAVFADSGAWIALALSRDPLHKLSAVDATGFAIMKRARIRIAFAFDHHFAVAGYRLVA